MPGRGNRKCKDLEVGACLECSMNSGRPVWLKRARKGTGVGKAVGEIQAEVGVMLRVEY